MQSFPLGILILMFLVCHLVIWWFDEISKFEVRVFVLVYFQLRKREFDWSTVFCWTSKRFFFSVKKKGKQIFLLQNLKFHQISKSTDDVHTTLNKNLTNFEQPLKNPITQHTLVVVQDVGGFSKLRVPLRSILLRSITHYIHTSHTVRTLRYFTTMYIVRMYMRKVHPLT